METIVTFMNIVHGVHCLNLDRLSVPNCNLSDVHLFIRVERARVTKFVALVFSFFGGNSRVSFEAFTFSHFLENNLVSDLIVFSLAHPCLGARISTFSICAMYLFWRMIFGRAIFCLCNAIFYPCIFVFPSDFI